MAVAVVAGTSAVAVVVLTPTRAARMAVAAGQAAYAAGIMPARDMAVASTPIFGMAELA